MPCRLPQVQSSRLFFFAQSSYTPFNKVELRSNAPDSFNILQYNYFVNQFNQKYIIFFREINFLLTAVKPFQIFIPAILFAEVNKCSNWKYGETTSPTTSKPTRKSPTALTTTGRTTA